MAVIVYNTETCDTLRIDSDPTTNDASGLMGEFAAWLMREGCEDPAPNWTIQGQGFRYGNPWVVFIEELPDGPSSTFFIHTGG